MLCMSFMANILRFLFGFWHFFFTLGKIIKKTILKVPSIYHFRSIEFLGGTFEKKLLKCTKKQLQNKNHC